MRKLVVLALAISLAVGALAISTGKSIESISYSVTDNVLYVAEQATLVEGYSIRDINSRISSLKSRLAKWEALKVEYDKNVPKVIEEVQ